MENAFRPGGAEGVDAGLKLIASNIATYLAVANKRLSIKSLSIGPNVLVAHQCYYAATPPEYQPTAAEILRIQQKIVTYFPWFTWLEERSLVWTPKALATIRSICYFAAFPPSPFVSDEERLRYPPTIAEFPRKAWLDAVIRDTPSPLARQIDRDLLREDLQLCLILFRIEKQLGSNERFTNRAEHLVKIRNHAKQLIELLSISVDDWNEMGIDWIFPELAVDLVFPEVWPGFSEVGFVEISENKEWHILQGPLLKSLKHLLDDTKDLLSDSLPSPLLHDRRTPMERLLGQNLPIVFETHFNSKAGGGEGGPFARFSQAILRMMRESAKPATVVSAISDVRKNRFRRVARRPRGGT